MSDGFTPEQARAALTLQAVAPIIIPPLVTNDGFGGLRFEIGHKITTAIGQPPSIADQEASPTKPADKAVSFSTYGVVIPISLGRRRMGGNVLECTPIKSVMEGTYDYFVDYQIPVTTTTEDLGGIAPDSHVDNNDTLQSELIRHTHTERIYQTGNPANYVDVEVIDDIQFKNPSSLIRNFVLNN